MKLELAQKLARSKAIQEESQMLQKKLSQQTGQDKNEVYQRVTRLAQSLEVELTPDILQLMGNPNEYNKLSELIIQRAADYGKKDSFIT